MITIIVADNGPGISREHHARLFERFERATVDEGVSGMGIGLFIVRQIVQGHGGTVRLESDRGIGAKFIVELPSQPVKGDRSI